MAAIQSMLSAIAFDNRVAIGRDSIQELRCLSDARALQCPLCRGIVVLKAGSILAPHFAHLPGAVCSHHDAEPETPRHREGKALLARWIRSRLPDSTITIEAIIAETGQRADLLVTTEEGARVAVEYQCADLSGRDWRRRSDSYRSASILDLWILGGNRLIRGQAGYRITELEREIAKAGRALLFLDSVGEHLPSGHLARLRLKDEAVVWASGTVSSRPIESLDFPWNLLRQEPPAPATPPKGPESPSIRRRPERGTPEPAAQDKGGDAAIWRWLRLKHGVVEESLPEMFGLDVEAMEAFGCSARAWQAAVYYRWVHGRVGEAWWLEQVNVWARKRLPIAVATGKRAHRALAGFQEHLTAAGILSPAQGEGRARVRADLTTLPRIPDAQEITRLASYRRTLRRDD